MKTLRLITFALLASALTAPAQFNFDFAFNSGSTGSDGPLNVTTSTNMDLPSNGIFNFTTIHVSTGATLRFSRNPANTPVYLLAQGDVNIAGTIDVSGDNAIGGARVGGKGGPGGADGGFPAFNSLLAGYGYGPGGGSAGDYGGNCGDTATTAGSGAYGSSPSGSSIRHGQVYGSPLLVPLVGGSGGGGAAGVGGGGGGGGGGALLIASSTRIDITGTVKANGGTGIVRPAVGGLNPCSASYSSYGSGGGIRLVAPAVAGTGSIRATAPVESLRSYGRIRIDSIDRHNVPSNLVPTASIGTYMVTFPPSRLDIVEVGTTTISEGSGPVAIQLPTDSSTNITVTVQARNFNAMVTNLVVLTPENGPRSVYTNIIDNRSPNDTATGTVIVGLPVNTIVTINAWTR